MESDTVADQRCNPDTKNACSRNLSDGVCTAEIGKSMISTLEKYTVQGAKGDYEISFTLNGYAAHDYYATNLNLTGSTNWFGSHNLCSMIAAEAKTLFPQHSEQSEFTSPFTLLELGSGIGRAGIMAALTMKAENNHGYCVLSDGEEALVQIARKNCVKNELNVECIQLWWGENEELHRLCDTQPDGFDLIIGGDVLYGPKALTAVKAIFHTVNSLLGINGIFFLAFSRRSTIALEDIETAAKKFNFTCEMHEDYTFDIFENDVDPNSMFWRDTVLTIKRKKENTTDESTEDSIS